MSLEFGTIVTVTNINGGTVSRDASLQILAYTNPTLFILHSGQPVIMFVDTVPRPPTAQINCTIPVITPSSLPDGSVGVSYNQSLSAIDGTAPFSFNVSSGIFPNGLTLNFDGTISGKPTTVGTYTFQIHLTDANLCEGFQSYTIIISPSKKKSNRGNGVSLPPIICLDRIWLSKYYPDSCRQGGVIFYSDFKIPYVFSHINVNGNCCFKLINPKK